MGFFSSLAWIIITFLFFTVMVAVVSSLKTKEDNLDTAEGYFLASRSLPGVVIAGSLLLTNLSAEQLVGLNGQSWATNMSPIGWEVGSIFTLLILAYYFLPRYLKMGTTTIPALMEERFGKSTKLVFSTIIVIMYSILNLPVILYSGAVVFERIFDISGMIGCSKFAAVAGLCVVIGIVGGCYAIFGGLKAVAVSDTINGIGLLIAGILIPFIALSVLAKETGGSGIIDGWKYMVEADPAKMNAWSDWNSAEPNLPWPLIFTGMLFNNIYWWCCNQSFVQRSLAAKSLKEGAYPALISAVVPKPIMGFFAAVLFGAILSSFNSVLNSASTMFTLDIFRSTELGKRTSDEKCVRIAKYYGTIAGIVAICIGPFVMYANGITTFLNSMSQFVSLPIVCTILGVFMFRKAPKYSPMLITVFHVIVYGAFMLIKPCYPGTTEPVHYLYAMAVLFPIELIIMWVLNKMGKDPEYEVKDVGAVDLTPWKYRHVVSIVGIVIAVIIYLVFSPVGIAK